MILTTTRLSGSAENTDEENVAVPVEDGNDILHFCPGGCKKKVLFFGFNTDSDWGDQLNDSMCIECRSRLIKDAMV